MLDIKVYDNFRDKYYTLHYFKYNYRHCICISISPETKLKNKGFLLLFNKFEIFEEKKSLSGQLNSRADKLIKK